MSTTTAKPATVRLVAAVASLLLVSALIVRTTDAAFTATTENESNSFAAGSVALLDDDGDLPMFDVTADGTTFSVNSAGLVPGDTRANCIVLTYDGDVAADVTLTVNGVGAGLADYLNVTIDSHASNDCSGASTSVAGTLSGLASGALSGAGWDTSWSPSANGEEHSFRFTVAVADDNAAQGLSASDIDFVWQASSS